MSEHITHVAAYEDSMRMMLSTDTFHEAFRQAVEKEYPSGLITSGTRGNHTWVPVILDDLGPKWKKSSYTEEEWIKLAGAVGWISHRAADVIVKPVYRALKAKNDPVFTSTENQIYHDAISLANVYMGGKKSTLTELERFSTKTLLPSTKPRTEEQFAFYWRNEFLALHQFCSKENDPAKWLDFAMGSSQRFSENLEEYIRAFASPEEKKMDKYLDEQNFYNEEDEIIRYVRNIQYDKDQDVKLEKALKKAEGQSMYARILLKAYDYFAVTADYFDQKIDREALTKYYIRGEKYL